jgi:hypothetical protein
MAAMSQPSGRAQPRAYCNAFKHSVGWWYRRPLALALPFAPWGIRHIPTGNSQANAKRFQPWTGGARLTRAVARRRPRMACAY